MKTTTTSTTTTNDNKPSGRQNYCKIEKCDVRHNSYKNGTVNTKNRANINSCLYCLKIKCPRGETGSQVASAKICHITVRNKKKKTAKLNVTTSAAGSVIHLSSFVCLLVSFRSHSVKSERYNHNLR